MLIEATIKNYRSIKGPVVFSLLSSSDKDNIETKSVMIDSKRRVLKNAAIYGPNGSGKSNIFSALNFMGRFISNSSKMNSSDFIEFQPFKLDDFNDKNPSLFEVVFYKDNKKYRYGFEITQKSVVSEWLFIDYSIRESKIFVREGKNVSTGEKCDIPKKAIEITRENGLFIVVGDQLNSEIAREVLEWFKNFNVISNLHDRYTGVTIDLLQEKDINYAPRKMVVDSLKKADIGIESIEIKEELVKFKDLVNKNEIPEPVLKLFLEQVNKTEEDEIESFDIFMTHNKFNQNGQKINIEKFNIDEESEGTKRLFSLLGPIIDTLYNNRVLFIDELESSLHPILFDKIIDIINSKAFIDSKSQIVFITHNTSLLDFKKLRKDQIWFAEKDKYGDTKLFSLLEYKLLRKDINLEKSYLKGIFGAIPKIELLCGE